MSDEDESQQDYEFVIARWAGEEWLVDREVFYRYTEGYKERKGIGQPIPNEENTPFTAEEQILIDLNSLAFIEKYYDLSKITAKQPVINPAEIEGMPETNLSQFEWETSQDLLTFMVSGDLWSQYLYGDGIIELQPNQIKVAEEALIRFTGSETYLQKWKDGELDYKDQYIIDQNARLFNVKYAEKLPSHKIKLIADIVNMPEIELEAEVWAEALQILNNEVGTVW